MLGSALIAEARFPQSLEAEKKRKTAEFTVLIFNEHYLIPEEKVPEAIDMAFEIFRVLVSKGLILNAGLVGGTR